MSDPQKPCRECGGIEYHVTRAEDFCPLVPTALVGRKSPVQGSQRVQTDRVCPECHHKESDYSRASGHCCAVLGGQWEDNKHRDRPICNHRCTFPDQTVAPETIHISLQVARAAEFDGDIEYRRVETCVWRERLADWETQCGNKQNFEPRGTYSNCFPAAVNSQLLRTRFSKSIAHEGQKHEQPTA